MYIQPGQSVEYLQIRRKFALVSRIKKVNSLTGRSIMAHLAGGETAHFTQEKSEEPCIVLFKARLLPFTLLTKLIYDVKGFSVPWTSKKRSTRKLKEYRYEKPWETLSLDLFSA